VSRASGQAPVQEGDGAVDMVKPDIGRRDVSNVIKREWFSFAFNQSLADFFALHPICFRFKLFSDRWE
jgi:hypothetical protein